MKVNSIDGTRYTIDDTLIKKVKDKVLVLECKEQLGDDIYVNFYTDIEYFRSTSVRDEAYYVEVEGSGTEMGREDGSPVAFYDVSKYKYYKKEVYNEITGMTDRITYCEITNELRAGTFANKRSRYFIHNNNIYKYEFWIPDTVVNANINMDFIFHYYYNSTVHIGKNVKVLGCANIGKIVNDDVVNTSLEKLDIFRVNADSNIVIKLRNCINLDHIYVSDIYDNLDSVDIYVDKKYRSLSKKKWTHDNCLVTDCWITLKNTPHEKIDWKGLFNRSISDEADNYMCVQTDEAVVQIPLYMVQDGQSIDVDNALLIKEDEGVYYCPVTKEKTDKSIMAIQSTDCVYYVDSE